MTGRSEDSGLIDLDALLKSGATDEPPSRAPESAPTPESSDRPTLEASAPPFAAGPRSAPAEKPAAKEPVAEKPAAKESAVEAPAAAKEPRASEPARGVAAADTTDRQLSFLSESPPAHESDAAGSGHRFRRTALGALVGVAAVACVFVMIRSRTPSESSELRTAAPPGAPSEIEESTPTEAPVADNAPAAPGLSPDDLPPATAEEEPEATAEEPEAKAPAARAGRRPAPKPREPAQPAPAATLTEAALEPSAASGGSDLGSAIRETVGARDVAAAPTAERSGPTASQVRPSQGAVVGALGAVLPSARACLGPDAPIRTGTVTFASDGTVARVEIAGSRPEDDCVRAALAKAKVAPFVDKTFSTRVTVRP